MKHFFITLFIGGVVFTSMTPFSVMAQTLDEARDINSTSTKEDVVALSMVVRKGYNLSITLRSNPTSKQQWQIVDGLDEDYIKFVSRKFSGFHFLSKLMGGGGKEIWAFKALKKGETKIRLENIKEGEEDNPIEIREYTVRIIGE